MSALVIFISTLKKKLLEILIKISYLIRKLGKKLTELLEQLGQDTSNSFDFFYILLYFIALFDISLSIST